MSKDFVNQYAKALFEIGDSLEEKTSFLTELREVKKALIDNQDALNFLKSVDIKPKQKVEAVGKALEQSKVNPKVCNTVKLLTERNKAIFLPALVSAYESLSDQANGVVRGVVKSAYELSVDQRNSIATKIESVLGKKVILDYILDPKVIGGMKAQVGSYTFDDTFETHLRKMKDQINRSVN